MTPVPEEAPLVDNEDFDGSVHSHYFPNVEGATDDSPYSSTKKESPS